LSVIDVLRATMVTTRPVETLGELLPLADAGTLARFLRANLGRAIVTARIADLAADACLQSVALR